ncbi:unnamed protein product [Sphagnum jensenii]|uniref:Glutaredoxin-dependent peroxiredoxin n=1 Tax=Sphagnum jensenii TaxID=128206 RepID=A0ABP1BSA4_9BRYO
MPCSKPVIPKNRPFSCGDNSRKFPYVEVWGPDGLPRRFAPGTRSSFAVDRFNKQLVDAVKPVVCVEACKDGEDPIEFGPEAELIAPCSWDLRVVQEAPFAPISAGDKIPNGELTYLDDDGKLQKHVVYDLVRNKKVIFFGVPGAFTPTCSVKHVPGFIERAAEIKDKGIVEIICITVNDPWVVKEWEKTYYPTTMTTTKNEDEHLKFLCDGSAKYTKALGLELDLVERGMGVRSRRYCLLIDDLFVKIANIEEGGALQMSTAKQIMEDLDSGKGYSVSTKRNCISSSISSL